MRHRPPRGAGSPAAPVGPEPAYLASWRSGALAAKVEQAREELRACGACPRGCGVDRLAGHTAACYTGRHGLVASFFAHHGEEDCLRGWAGSGTIFFARCNLRCVFCQNWDISQERSAGREVTAAELAAIMLHLQAQGCHNINLVTPEHVVPQIVEALPAAIAGGLHIPLVYNTSAYDALSSLRLMEGLVDVYLPDFKVWDPQRAHRWLRARDYPAVARAAIAEMHRQVGELRLDENGLAVRGVLLRHLVMPDALEDTRAILRWVAGQLSPRTHVNVMGQYRPAFRARQFPELGRALEPREHAQALAAARAEGLLRLDERRPPRPPGW